MTDFNSLWVEIFRAGDYGDKGQYTPDDLDAMVKNFAHWQPPAVLGHPATDSPAMGWAKTIKREGNVLLAQFEKAQPAFVDAVRDGRFPNRSIAIYKDPKGSGPAVRHIGFLGATPPEVKGLAPIQFGDGEFIAIEFKESEDVMDKTEIKNSIREFFSEMFGTKERTEPQFDEAKLSKMVGDAVTAANKPLNDKIETLSEENKKLREGTAATQASARVSEIRTFVDGLKAQGKWVPAMDSILPFVETAASEGKTVEFGEGDKKETLSALDALKRHASLLGQIVPLGESKAGRARSKGGKVVEFTEAKGITLDSNSAQLQEFAEQLMEKNDKLSFGEALKLARREHPELSEPIAVGQV